MSSPGVSWGELTSSQLMAHSYEEASKRAKATDYYDNSPALSVSALSLGTPQPLHTSTHPWDLE